jgi:hypothetical protein
MIAIHSDNQTGNVVSFLPSRSLVGGVDNPCWIQTAQGETARCQLTQLHMQVILWICIVVLELCAAIRCCQLKKEITPAWLDNVLHI